MVNQIMLCYNYCKKYKRKLIIDTKQTPFKLDLNNYFKLNDDNIIESKNYEYIYNDTELSIYPEFLSNYELKNIKYKWYKESNGIVYVYNKKKISFDFNKNYYHNILVHVECGGGYGIRDFFKTFNMNDRLLKVLYYRYISLPKNYISVHIRNTDFVSNVEEFIIDNYNNFIGKDIFLASDNINSIYLFKKVVKANIYTFSNIPDSNNQGIHFLEKVNKDQMNIDCIIDFILLILGKEFYYSSKESGYSNNANKLNKDIYFKKHIINQISHCIF